MKKIDWTRPIRFVNKTISDKVTHMAQLSRGNTNLTPNHVCLYVETSGAEGVTVVDEYGYGVWGRNHVIENVPIPKPEPHEHADVIRAYADGYKIATYVSDEPGHWVWQDYGRFYRGHFYGVIDGQGYEGPAKVVQL
jgi:hypothetical protein